MNKLKLIEAAIMAGIACILIGLAIQHGANLAINAELILGHRYLVFAKAGQATSYVHDPDCPNDGPKPIENITTNWGVTITTYPPKYETYPMTGSWTNYVEPYTNWGTITLTNGWIYYSNRLPALDRKSVV